MAGLPRKRGKIILGRRICRMDFENIATPHLGQCLFGFQNRHGAFEASDIELTMRHRWTLLSHNGYSTRTLEWRPIRRLALFDDLRPQDAQTGIDHRLLMKLPGFALGQLQLLNGSLGLAVQSIGFCRGLTG